ncbi:ABC transporter ATP-binding protein [Halioxenophilus sp. WMMB6]|uniref:ABC transporter ATP-binding protein n=1 Tax=Halioxenophilus sp. WMMB6 TaxID=3073815 RepID=UPI00295EA9FC|nr:ABC transporter ATP-binding protein [Halioxenophilus sp. WMMB6]
MLDRSLAAIREVFKILNKKERFEATIVFASLALTSIIEVVVILGLVPVIVFLVGFDSAEEASKFSFKGYAINFVGGGVLTPLSVVVLAVGFLLFSGLLRMLNVFVTRRYLRRICATIGQRVYARMLRYDSGILRKYSESEFANDLNANLDRIVTGCIGQPIMIAANLVFIVFVIGVLCSVNLVVTFVVLSIIGLLYLLIFAFVKPVLTRWSRINREKGSLVVQMLTYGYRGYRQIVVNGWGEEAINNYRVLRRERLREVANTEILNGLPKILVETFAFVLMVYSAFYLGGDGGDPAHLITLLSFFVVSAYRIMPAAQQIYTAFSTVVYSAELYSLSREKWNLFGGVAAVSNEQNVSSQSVGGPSKFVPCEKVEFRGATHHFEKGDGSRIEYSFVWNLSQVNLLYGASGSGKSTLLDVLLGLLAVDHGQVHINRQELKAGDYNLWRKSVFYIPQMPVLPADNVMACMNFVNEKISIEEVNEILKVVKLERCLITAEEEKVVVGQNGVGLSGGERCRLLIAMAVASGRPFLILDETLSGIDESTVEVIINALVQSYSGIQLLIVTHNQGLERRISELGCSLSVFNMENMLLAGRV